MAVANYSHSTVVEALMSAAGQSGAPKLATTLCSPLAKERGTLPAWRRPDLLVISYRRGVHRQGRPDPATTSHRRVGRVGSASCKPPEKEGYPTGVGTPEDDTVEREA